MSEVEVKALEQESAPAQENEEAAPSGEASGDEAAEAQAPDVEEETAAAGELPNEEVFAEELVVESAPGPNEDAQLKAVLEAVIYITDEPLSPGQMAAATGQPLDKINDLLEELTAEYNKPEHGLSIREIAGGYKMSTKPEHHEAVRAFVKNLKPPLKLSLAALETLAVIAYKQPITAPEIMEIRGVQGAGVLKTLIDRKLVATAGRKNVIGKPILYKTTKDFLVQFGLKDLSELPTLKEFEELGRLALTDTEEAVAPQQEGDEGTTTDTIPNDPGREPEPVKEPGPEPVPEHDPDPASDPGPPTDPEHQPVKAEEAPATETGDSESPS